MRFEQLDLNLLVALDAILQERHISRAAKRVNLSQSAMSSALGRLREYFEDELFVPIGRQMIATPRAESLAGPVRDLLLRIRATITNRPSFDPGTVRRTFYLAMSDYLSIVLLPSLIRLVQQQAPDVSLDVTPAAANAGERMELGHLDLLIGPRPYLSMHHPSAELLRDNHVCLVCRGNAAVGAALTTEQFFTLGHVASVFGTARTKSLCWNYLHERGQDLRAEVVVSGFSTVPFLLPGTNRIAILQERMARRFAAMLPLRIVPSPVALPDMVQLTQWRDVYTAEPGHIWLRQMVADAAASLDQA